MWLITNKLVGLCGLLIYLQQFHNFVWNNLSICRYFLRLFLKFEAFKLEKLKYLALS